MHRRARVLGACLLGVFMAAAASAQVDHFPVNDDGAHEMSIQGASHAAPYLVCDPPLGTLGGSFFDAGVGDEPFGPMSVDDNNYAVFSFDTGGWTCGEVFTLYLVEEGRWGLPFVELGPQMIVEYLDSALAYPDRWVNPAEVEGGGYALLGALTDVELYDPAGINLTAVVNALICGAHNRYFYLRFRLPICTNLDDEPDWTEIATGVGNPGRARIQEGRQRVIPTISGWGVALTILLLTAAAWWRLRR